ncbi:MAG: hypothetical protein P4L50_06080 [Anaerolineaceae bacterium]|nr:hypothetical protein [Anaerolineaceae bacterium]
MMKTSYRLLAVILLMAGLAGCSAPSQTQAPAASPVALSPTQPAGMPSAPAPSKAGSASVTSPSTAAQPLSTAAGQAPTPDTRQLPADWRNWPIVPAATVHAMQIYQQGLAMGNNPHAFSKVGDCQSITEALLGKYDQPGRYALTADQQPLQETINQFAGSFNRDGQAVKGGFNAAAVLSPMWADPDFCQAGENPLECEIRLHKPSFVIISLEVWWQGRTPDRYIQYMHQIIDYTIAHGAVPILSTKADNVEGDNSINLANATLAYQYDLPLWNFWRAAQALPNHGLDPVRNDGFHLSMDYGWPARSLTALESLDSVWRGVTQSAQGAQPSPTAAEVLKNPTAQAVTTSVALPAMTLQPALTPPVSSSAGTFVFGVDKKQAAGYQSQGVYSYDLAAGKLSRLVGAGFDLQAVAPDGSNMLINQGSQLYLANMDGSNQTLLDGHFAQDDGIGALWLADNKTIAVVSNRGGSNGIWLLASDGKTWTRLTPPGSSPIALYPSPDPKRVYWESGSCNAASICTRQGTFYTNLDGSQTSQVSGVLRPSFTNDGSYFAYNYLTGQNVSSLAVASLDRQIDRQLPMSVDKLLVYNLLDYAWSPDGKSLSFLEAERSNYSGKWLGVRHYILSLPGLGIQEMQRLPGLNGRTLWSPDGKSLLQVVTEQLPGAGTVVPPQQSGADSQASTGDYRLDFRLLDLASKKITALDDKIGLSGPDFLLVSNIFWVPGH